MISSNSCAHGRGGQALLQLAVRSGRPQAIHEALKRGANPNFRDKYNYTPLHRLVMSNPMDDAAIQELLKDKRIDPNIQNAKGNTPLHLSAEKSYKEAIKILVADPRTNLNVRNSENHSPLDLIRYKFHSQDATRLEKDCLKICFQSIASEIAARRQGPIVFAWKMLRDQKLDADSRTKNVGIIPEDIVSVISAFCMTSIPPIEVPPDQVTAGLEGKDGVKEN